MNSRATLAIVRKDTVEIVLNRSALITVLSPIGVALLFAVLNALLAGKTTRVFVFNPDNSSVVRIIADSPLPNIQITRASSAEEVAAAFVGSNPAYALGLAVPPGYDTAVRGGGRPALTLFVNAHDVDAATGRLVAGALAGQAATAPPVTVVTAGPPAPEAAPGLGAYLAMFGLVSSFIVGGAVVAGLLLEEKEKDTLRLLVASPATFADVVAGKLIVGLGYQLLLVVAVLAIQGGFVGEVGRVLGFGLLGSLLSLALGLLYGSLAKNTSAFGAVFSLISALYVLPALFVGPLGVALSDSPLVRSLQVVPTYYLARGILDAMLGRASDTALLDAAVVGGCAAIVLIAALWSLRREAARMGAKA